MMPIMAIEHGVVGVDYSPIFVVARESEAFAVTEQDFLPGVRIQELMNELQPDQHIYLVDLVNPGQELGIKLIRLT
jgi:hypothetical protein